MVEKEKQTEEKIFESATEIFLEKGMDGARMQDIADHAGINKSLLNYYYRSKDRLFNAVYEKLAGQLLEMFAPVFDENLSLEQKIRYFFREHISFLQKNPRLPVFILYEVNRNPERFRKLLQKFDVEALWRTLETQHRKELAKYNISMEMLPQLMSSLAALSVFPFAARSFLEAIFAKLGIDFDDYIEERKKFAADFTINALRK